MNAKFLALALFFGATLACAASDVPAQTNTSLSSMPGTSWNTNSMLWLDLTSGTNQPSVLRLGNSDFTMSGPLIEGFRRQPASESRSLGHKLLSLPVVRLLVPQRLPSPPSGGRYFAWHDSRRAWTSIATGSPPGSGFDSLHNEPRSSLITVEWRQ